MRSSKANACSFLTLFSISCIIFSFICLRLLISLSSLFFYYFSFITSSSLFFRSVSFFCRSPSRTPIFYFERSWAFSKFNTLAFSCLITASEESEFLLSRLVAVPEGPLIVLPPCLGFSCCKSLILFTQFRSTCCNFFVSVLISFSTLASCFLHKAWYSASIFLIQSLYCNLKSLSRF